MLALLNGRAVLLWRSGGDDGTREPFPGFAVSIVAGDRQLRVDTGSAHCVVSSDLPLPIERRWKDWSASGWRSADGWEPADPARLHLADRRQIADSSERNRIELFKRDQDRIAGDSVLPRRCLRRAGAACAIAGKLAYQVVDRHKAGLNRRATTVAPKRRLEAMWLASLDSLARRVLGRFSAWMSWNELGTTRSDCIVSRISIGAVVTFLLLLPTLPEGEGATIESFSQRLKLAHPPWNWPASRRVASEQRAATQAARRLGTRLFLGPFYQ